MAESFSAWWGGDPADIRLVAYEFTGDYWWLYLLMLAGNVVAPQLFWAPRLRTNVWALTCVSVGVLVGMWLERILILLTTLSNGYEPSFWRTYAPTLVDFLILMGTLAAFVWLFLILGRLIPVVSMHEVRELVAEEAR
jgi:molybdopterin-containing oxidoreductase family membrane subunit